MREVVPDLKNLVDLRSVASRYHQEWITGVRKDLFCKTLKVSKAFEIFVPTAEEDRLTYAASGIARNLYAEELIELGMVAIDAINEMLINEFLPMSAKSKQYRFGKVLFFGLELDNTLCADNSFHETAVSQNGLVEGIVILLKISLFQRIARI